mgnify:CR=1 FL=1
MSNKFYIEGEYYSEIKLVVLNGEHTDITTSKMSQDLILTLKQSNKKAEAASVL